MKLTEKILVALSILAIVLKLLLIPGGSVLFVLAISILSCIYFALGFALFNGIRLRKMFKKESYSNTSALKIIGAICMGFVLSMVSIGIMFKLQMWPGAGPMLIVGAPPMFIILIIVFVKFILTKHKFYLNALIRCGIFTLFGIALFFTSGLTLIKLQFRNHPEYIQAYEAYQNNPSSLELFDKMETERMRATTNPENFARYMEYKNEMDKELQK